ncbi:MAG TPA: Xaa-Pro peptidase family protein [Thermodesulfobacteriota bacterium]|nr:Xaa-Pro peptidase family protein [Thermodesulfobacteriota bacterium]
MAGKDACEARLGEVVESLKRTDMDALLLNRVGNIAYLTGAVNSCSWVFITRKGERVALVLDSDAQVYREDSAIGDVRSFRIHDPFALFRSVIDELGLVRSKIGLELSRPGLPQHVLAMLKYALPSTVETVNGEPVIEEVRVIKSNEEIEAIKAAVRIAELGMDTAIKNLRPGVRESDVVLEAEYAMRKAGGRIPTLNYVGSGKRSCIAHHTPSSKVVQKGEVVTLDIHGGYGAYCADLARTAVCGKIGTEVQDAYDFLVRAEEETLKACRQGNSMVDVKKTFYRKLAEAKPYHFLLGPVVHGVGIMNSELPHFTFPHQDKGYPEILQANMVVAVSNIGLYSDQGWGVRIEDTAVVTESETVLLTRYSKELIQA